MDLPLNHNKALTMHVDMNSCYASIEQQCNRFFRGKPLVVVPYLGKNAVAISVSTEAKRLGIKMPIYVRDAKLICKDLIVVEADPDKYEDANIKFSRIFQDYTPSPVPKSIDEIVCDFSHTTHELRDMRDIGMEIKQRVKKEIGEWMRVSVGIAPNRFYAKVAAGLHKPDGLDVIDYTNIEEVLSKLTLMDLPGINIGYTTRLNMAGIFTPLEFLHTPCDVLEKIVFKSIEGRRWYERLRGYEADRDYKEKSFGKDYALHHPTSKIEELSVILEEQTHRAARRMRKAGYECRGVHLAFWYKDLTNWHRAYISRGHLYTSQEIYRHALKIMLLRPIPDREKVVTKMGISCYGIVPIDQAQLMLFDYDNAKERKVSETMDAIADKYGETAILTASRMNTAHEIKHRIAFGGTRGLEDLYEKGTKT